jgi:predicted MPP superfamily phosphohydrolase
MQGARRDWLRWVLGGGLLAGSGLMGWTVLLEPDWLQVTGHNLSIPNLPAAWHGRRLVHISDLHAGKVRTGFLLRAIRVVNQIQPDLLVITGDFIDYSTGLKPDLEEVFRELKRAKIATVACLGNHDFGRGWSQLAVAGQVTELAARYGVQVLRNQRLELGGLNIIGIDDYWSPTFDPGPLQHADAQQANICLCHNPDVCDEDIWNRFTGVILAGHTHGGQCKPPFLPPPVLPVENHRFTAGFFNVGPGRELFISRGLGYSRRIRFNCRPEITIFNLQAGEEKRGQERMALNRL